MTSGAASTATSSGARTADASPPRPGYGFAPMYFPGTADPDQAAILVLGEGEERGGIDIGFQFVRMAAVEGRVSNPTGVVPPGTQLTIKRLTCTGNPDRPTRRVG